MDRATAVSILLLGPRVIARVIVAAARAAHVRGRRLAKAEQRVAELLAEVRLRAKREEALLANQARWRGIVESMPQLIWTASGEGLIDYFSPAVAQFTGLNHRDLLGLSWFESIHPAERAGTQVAWLDAVAHGRGLDVEHRLQRHDGTYQWFRCQAAPVRDGEGRTLRWAVISTDIDDRKLTEQRSIKAETQLWLTMRVCKSSLWEYALTDGSVANSHLVENHAASDEVPVSPTINFAAVSALVGMPEDDQQRVTAAVQACVDGETPEFQVEFRYRHADGSMRWRFSRGSVRRDAEGLPRSFFGVAMDTTELKHAQQETLAMKERLDLALRASEVTAWDLELQGGVFTPADYLSSFEPVVAEQDHARVSAAIEACISGETQLINVQYRAPGDEDQDVHWRLARGCVLRNERGAPLRLTGTSRDITNLKREEEARRAATEQLTLATQLSRVYIWIYDLVDGQIAGARATFLNVWESLGYDQDPAIIDFAASLELVILPEDQGPVMQAVAACLEGRTPQFEAEYRIRHKDGSLHWNLGRGIVTRDEAGVPLRFLGTSVDITELKRVEQESRTVKDRLELAMLGSKVCTWDHEMDDGNIATARSTMINVWESLGYDVVADAHHFTAGLASLIHPEDQQGFATHVQSFLNGTEREWESEFRVRHRNGSDVWHLARGVVARDANGRAVRFTGSSVDITDRKRMEEALRQSEERFRATFENAAVGMAVSNVEGRFIQCNERLAEFLGYSRSELIGRPFTAFVAPDDAPPDLERHARFLGGDLPNFARDKQYVRKDGSRVWGNMAASIIERNAEGEPTHVMAIVQDISQRKTLEQDLQRTKDRLELAVHSSNISIFEFEMPDGRLENSQHTLINFWELVGYHPDEVPSSFAEACALVLTPDDYSRVPAEMQAYLSGARPRFDLEHQVRHKDGSLQWRLARGMAVRNEQGVAVRFIGSHVDITEKKQVEDKLRASEQRWRILTETLPQLVWTARSDGVVDYLSGQTIEYTGRPLGELLDGWAAALHPDDREPTSNAWSEAVQKQSAYEVQHRIRRSDGEYRWFTTRGKAVRDGQSRVVGWFGTSTDVQALKQLEAELRQAKERLELAIRSSNMSIWEYDMPDGRIENSQETLTNFWESMGYEAPPESPPLVAPEGYLRRSSDVMHADDQARVADELRAYLGSRGLAFETECRVLHNDGAYRWVLARGVAIRNAAGEPIRFVGTSTDITEIKRIEAELQRARQAAEAANRAKDDFLANVSHEIRTPMNAILGMTELALDAARSEHQRQLLSTVKSAARNLLGIINDLLDFSKIAAGKLALDPADFSLTAVLGDTMRALAPRAHRKGLELICNVSPEVPGSLYGDAGRLRQILMNLVGNAVKFTAQGRVTVEVTLVASEFLPADPDAVRLLFAVQDTGVGIAREKQGTIFRAFEQEDASTTRKYGGTGLGLTISAELAALMGGDISVSSEPGMGSTFRVTAQFVRTSRTQLLSAAANAEVLEGLRVLVVDDDATNRQLLVETLTGWRMHPTAVGDARSALEVLYRADELGTPYSLVLLDARMPDEDGISLARRIHERFGVSSKRLILLSSDDSAELPARSREVGIGAYLLKPVQQSELLETIWVVMNMPGDPMLEPTLAPSDPIGRALRPLRILVAEDNELNVALLHELLRQRGHQAQFASNGRAALVLATTGAFDLLLLDLHMPELDGFQVVRALRESERATGKHLPIIALTARSSARDRERCLGAGMDDFLSKPIEARALWAAIERIVVAFPSITPPASALLDARAILRACGDEASILERLRDVFQRSLPEHMSRVHAALRAEDPEAIGEAAHLLYGTLSAFSSVAGALALTLEDSAARLELESCRELVGRLDAMCAELLQETRTLTLSRLQP